MELNLDKELIDAIAEKVGIVIDWSIENIYPQLIEILERYRLYELIWNGFFTIFGFIFLIWGIVSTIKIFIELDKIKKNGEAHSVIETKHWYVSYYHDGTLRTPDLKHSGIITLALNGMMVVGCGTAFLACFRPFLNWLILPEIQFYNLIIGG